MGIELLTDRFADQIAGVLSCYDRLIVQGTIPDFCYAQAMTNYLNARQICSLISFIASTPKRSDVSMRRCSTT